MKDCGYVFGNWKWIVFFIVVLMFLIYFGLNKMMEYMLKLVFVGGMSLN